MNVINERLARVHRRKALLKLAKDVGVVDWDVTAVDDRSLNAWETYDHAYISVRIKVDRKTLVQYETRLRRRAEKKGEKK